MQIHSSPLKLTSFLILKLLGCCAISSAFPCEAYSADFKKPSYEPTIQAEIDNRVRLESIGYRLARANADRCSIPNTLTGLLLQDIATYGPSRRQEAKAYFDMDKGFGVLGVVSGSPADLAGIVEGDEIIAINGIDLSTFYIELTRGPATYDRSNRFVDYLDNVLVSRTAEVTIRHNGRIATTHIARELGCGGRFVVKTSNELNAWSDGKYVAVTTRMLNDVKDDQELAFVVAHEMSHNILHHAGLLQGKSNILAQLGIGAGETRRTEAEADAYAVKLMSRANFDLSAPLRLLKHMREETMLMDLVLMRVDFSHPGIWQRLNIVHEAIAGLTPQDRPLAASIPPEIGLLNWSYNDPLSGPQEWTPQFASAVDRLAIFTGLNMTLAEAQTAYPIKITYGRPTAASLTSDISRQFPHLNVINTSNTAEPDFPPEKYAPQLPTTADVGMPLTLTRIAMAN